MTGGYRQTELNKGKGNGETSEGNNVKFEFFTTKGDVIAKLFNYQEERIKRIQVAGTNLSSRKDTQSNVKINIKPVGKYYALLIGNSNYSKKGKFTNLTSPKNDVTELSEILEKKYDFDVITALDVSRNKFFDKLDELKSKVTDQDYVLIYYSGHGEKIGNERYWIPVDAAKDNRRNWINIDDVTVSFEGSLPEIPSTHLALLVDSCWFKVKGDDKVSNKEMALNKLLRSRTAVVMASGTDQRVDDPDEGNSESAKIIISKLENTELPLRLYDIYTQVRDEIGGKQTAIYRTMTKWNHNKGDFVFIPKDQL